MDEAEAERARKELEELQAHRYVVVCFLIILCFSNETL